MKQVPSLKQLEYLVSLDDTKHFGNASRQCHVTPSTLSAGIRELEAFLGVSLAERTKRMVLMTPQGAEIARRARFLLRDAEYIMSYAQGQLEASKVEMHLGVIPSVGPFLLPRILPALRDKFPDMKLYLREEKTLDLLSKLRSGKIDLALLALPFETEELCVESLMDDPYHFVCHPDHPLAKRKRIHSIDLADTSLMLLEEGHCLRDHVLEACRLEKSAIRSEFEATSLHTLVQMVSAGLGVTLLPEIAIQAHFTAGMNVCVIPVVPKQSREIGLVWRSTSPYVDRFVSMTDFLRDVLPL